MCEETADEYRIGNLKAREFVKKTEVHALVGAKVTDDPTMWCPFSMVSRGKWPAACCGTPGAPGHTSHTDTAHRFNNLPKPGTRKQILGLLCNLAATSEATFVAPSAAPSRFGEVPRVSPTVFDITSRSLSLSGEPREGNSACRAVPRI